MYIPVTIKIYLSHSLLRMRAYIHVRIGNCRQPVICIFFDAVASREATSSNVFPSSFSFSPFQYMMRHLFQIPVLHTKEGILKVGSICWNESLHYWFYLSRTFNTIIFTVLLFYCSYPPYCSSLVRKTVAGGIRSWNSSNMVGLLFSWGDQKFQEKMVHKYSGKFGLQDQFVHQILLCQ